MTGIRLQHVPYRGAAPALNDLLAGQVDAMIVDVPAGGEFVRAGSVRALATCGAARPAGIADVPTLQGTLALPGFDVYPWQFLMVPRATDRAVVERLDRGLSAVLARDDVQDRLRKIGVEPLRAGPETVSRMLAEGRAYREPLIKALGLELDG